MTCEPWPISWVCGEPQLPAEQMTVAIDAARSILWGRTGRRLGVCETTETYRLAGPGGTCGGPYKDAAGNWRNGGLPGVCCSFPLAQSPVTEVVEVSVSGAVLGAEAYMLESGRLRNRSGCWPVVRDCDDPVIRVTYRWCVPLREGDPYYSLVAAAMSEVAREVAEGMCGRACKLPGRAVSITRQGVTVNMESNNDVGAAGLLGLPLSDELILTVNPHRLTTRPRVYSPDLPRVR
jgi:hypothetical protein